MKRGDPPKVNGDPALAVLRGIVEILSNAKGPDWIAFRDPTILTPDVGRKGFQRGRNRRFRPFGAAI